MRIQSSVFTKIVNYSSSLAQIQMRVRAAQRAQMKDEKFNSLIACYEHTTRYYIYTRASI